MEAHETGSLPGTGSFRCGDCGYEVSLATRDELPACPSCGGTEFSRAAFMNTEAQDAPSATPEKTAEWYREARERLEQAGDYLAYEEGSAGNRTVRIVPLTREWTRVGRSLAADVRFDDPSVSRRHALIVRGPDGVRVLDDRSLNGVFVNGERVEWSTLADGDEILVGSHSLRFLEIAAVSGLRPGTPEQITLAR